MAANDKRHNLNADVVDTVALKISGNDKTSDINSIANKADKTTTINGQDLSANRTFTQDDIGDGTTYKQFSATNKTKLDNITVTQAVDLDAIETRVNALDAAVVLVGTWDASAGTFPGGGTAQAGASYLVSVNGTVDGVEFKVGDRVIAITDNASTTTFASNWFHADYTDKVSSVAGRTGNVVIVAADLADFNSAALSAAPAETATTIGNLIEGSTQKATIVDADRIGYWDSVADVLKYMLFSDLKTVLKSWIDSLTTTFTNKRITPRVSSEASNVAPSIDLDSVDSHIITAQAANMTTGFTTTGTPTSQQKLVISITPTGSARNLVFDTAKFEESNSQLFPTVTFAAGVRMDMAFIYNAASGKMRLLSVS